MSKMIYNFYICKCCEFVYNNPDYTDCVKCGKSMCVLLFQATSKDRALKLKRKKYGK
jgi:hypothetical protein